MILKRGMPLGGVKQKADMLGLNPDALDHPDTPAPVLDASSTGQRAREVERARKRARTIPRVRTFDRAHKDGAVTLSRLVVHEDHRGLGLGGALTLAGAAYCAELGAETIVGMARTQSLVSYYEALGAVSNAEGVSPMPSRSTQQRPMQRSLALTPEEGRGGAAAAGGGSRGGGGGGGGGAEAELEVGSASKWAERSMTLELGGRDDASMAAVRRRLAATSPRIAIR